MEKLVKSLSQFFLLYLLFIPCKSFSQSQYIDKWIYFNSVEETQDYWVKSHGQPCCGVTHGMEYGGKYGIAFVGKTTNVWPNPYTLISTTERLWGQVQSCPPNTRINPDTGQCTSYSLAAPNTPPRPPCNTDEPTTAGNPIALGDGTKVQHEIDIPKASNTQLFFERYYNAAAKSPNIWSNNYTKVLMEFNSSTIIPLNKAISQPYPTASDACTSGWDSIKSGLTDSWAKNSTVEFKNDKCNVVRNNAVVNTLPIITLVDFVLETDTPAVHLQRPAGEVYVFQKDSTQTYYGIDGAPGTLVKIHSSNVEWRYTTANNDIEDYSLTGKLISITSTNGIKQTLTYDSVSGLLSQVQDSTGRKLTFTYTNNLLSGVTTDDNKTTSYTYNTAGLITDVKRPDNTHRLYHYEDSRFSTYLTGITDERGVRYATWVYDAQGRGISSQHAGGAEKTLLAFNADGSTTVTNSLNKQTIYRFDDVAGARRVVSVEGQPTTNCVGANQNYTYTTEGWVASKTDWKGNKTTFIYNTKGQEISRTEAFGTPVAKTITTEWHATLNLKTKVTEPDRETIYSYDANGLLIGQKNRSVVTP